MRPPVNSLLRTCNVFDTSLLPRQRRFINQLLDSLLPLDRGGADQFGEIGSLAVRNAGFGKTRSTILLFILLAKLLEIPLRVLLVVPTILFDTWVNEIALVAPQCSVTVYDAGVCLKNGVRAHERWKRMQQAAETANFFIVGMYPLRTELRKHQSGHMKQPSILWGDVVTKWMMCAIDEVHILRNASAKLFQAAKQMRGAMLHDEAKLVALTATPFVNRVSDVLNALSLVAGIDESLNGDAATAWLRTKYLNRENETIDVDVSVSLRVVSAQLLPVENQLYKEAQRRYVREYESDVTTKGRHARIHGELMRLRAMLECFDLPDGVCGSKLACVVAEARAAPTADRIVIFHIYKHTSKCIEKELCGFRAVFVLNGDVPVTKRGELLKKWACTPGGVLLAQLFVTGCGLNLQCASHVFFSLRWYNHAIEIQAIARVLRFGQTKPVQILFFVHEGVYIEGAWLDTLHANKREAEIHLFGDSSNLFLENSTDPEHIAGLGDTALQLLHEEFMET